MTDPLTPAVAPPSREALDQLLAYLNHKDDCAVWPNDGRRHHRSTMAARACTCGLDQLVSLLAVPPPQEAHQEKEIHEENEDQGSRRDGTG